MFTTARIAKLCSRWRLQLSAAHSSSTKFANNQMPPKTARATKPKPQAKEKPDFERVLHCPYKFGAHVSTAGGISKALQNASQIGANSFALFLKSPRKWVSPQISDEEAAKFKSLCQELGYDPKTDILPHGSYFINLANPDHEKEAKAFGSFVDDLKRCEKLGIGLYNFHPGSSLDGDHREALRQLAANINRAISETESVKIVIENMAGHGNLIGSDLQDIRDVLDMIDPDKRPRVGVCIDTCHAFAAGYDIGASQEAFDQFWEQFDSIIGWSYLSALHLNDSKAPLGANRDLHQKLGLGFLGLDTFRMVANCSRLQGIPIVLETPSEDVGDVLYGREIKLLEWMQDRKHDDAEFIAKLVQLAADGAAERSEQLAKFEVKVAKAKAKTVKRSGSDIGSMLTKKLKVKKETKRSVLEAEVVTVEKMS